MNLKTKKLVKDTIIFTIGNIGSKFIQFFLVPLYTYTLTTSEYGITELVLTAVNLLMPVFSVSIADGLLRFGLDKKLNKNDVLKCSVMIVFFGTILSCLCIPLYKISKTLEDWTIFFLLILNLRIYRDIFAIYLKINDKNKLFAIDSILYTFSLCAFSIFFLAYKQMGIFGYFLAYCFANTFSIFFLAIVGKPIKALINGKLERKLFSQLVMYSLPMIINGVAWWITNASDRFMLEWFMTDSDVGIYSAAAKLPALVTTFTGVFNQAWIISSVIEYDNEKEKTFYSNTFHNYYFLLFLATSILLGIIRPFMRIYVSQSFYEAWLYSGFLICSATVSGVAAFMVGIYASTKKNTHVMYTTLLGAVSNIVLNYYLIPRIGIMGASVATYFSWFIIAMVRIIDVHKIFSFYIDYKRIVFYICITFSQCCFVTFSETFGYVFSVMTVLVISLAERNHLKGLVNDILSRRI